jgi:thymidine kinase
MSFPATPGVLEVITGPMFSGKSEELIRRLKRARIARQRVACFKPDIDLRYHRTSISSHSAHTHEATTVANVEYLREALYPQLDSIEVIGIDEVQFFDVAIIPLAVELIALGKRVIMAGLDTTFAGEPFGPVPNLMAIADTVTKLSAVCMVCGAAAIHTQRLGQSQDWLWSAPRGSTKLVAARTSIHSWTSTPQSNWSLRRCSKRRPRLRASPSGWLLLMLPLKRLA